MNKITDKQILILNMPNKENQIKVNIDFPFQYTYGNNKDIKWKEVRSKTKSMYLFAAWRLLLSL